LVGPDIPGIPSTIAKEVLVNQTVQRKNYSILEQRLHRRRQSEVTDRPDRLAVGGKADKRIASKGEGICLIGVPRASLESGVVIGIEIAYNSAPFEVVSYIVKNVVIYVG
jgi:hypothetical protein